MPDEDAPTQLYEKAAWLKPVAEVALLPVSGVAEGTQCFVTSEGEIYAFVGGVWAVVPDADDEDST